MKKLLITPFSTFPIKPFTKTPPITKGVIGSYSAGFKSRIGDSSVSIYIIPMFSVDTVVKLWKEHIIKFV